jgi:hypothetical protein
MKSKLANGLSPVAFAARIPSSRDGIMYGVAFSAAPGLSYEATVLVVWQTCEQVARELNIKLHPAQTITRLGTVENPPTICQGCGATVLHAGTEPVLVCPACVRTGGDCD